MKSCKYKDFPRIPVGVMELNRNPENYHAEVEQAAFSPANVVPGLGFSPDKMLQGRLFGYHDAQLYRVGTNHQHLPVNKPRCPMHNFQRDGSMRFDGNAGCEDRIDCCADVERSCACNSPSPLMGEVGEGDR